MGAVLNREEGEIGAKMWGGSEISTRRKKLFLFFNLGHDVLCNRLGSPGTPLVGHGIKF